MGAMPSSEVQRTLVKSPPELWAELSDPVSLAKHLGEFGEIRTIRVEPETAVEWEAEDVRGAVQLKPSGWGTKVTLTAVRANPEAQAPSETEAPPAADGPPEPVAPPELEASSGPVAPPELKAAPGPVAPPELEASPGPVAPQDLEAVPKPEADPEPEPAPEPDLQPAATEEALAPGQTKRRRPRFLARLFRRRRAAPSAAPEPEQTLATGGQGEPELGGPTVDTLDGPELGGPTVDTLDGLELGGPTADAPGEPELPRPAAVAIDEPAPIEAPPAPQSEPAIEARPDLAAELAQVEQAMLDQDTALLTAVLDRLGAAHHRPFSRG